jgi:hypothetical protein
VFACTPDQFPGRMAAAIQRRDLQLWAARNDIVAAGTNRNALEITGPQV